MGRQHILDVKLGYQDNPAPAKVDVTVQDLPEADRLARIQELQEKLVTKTVSAKELELEG